MELKPRQRHTITGLGLVWMLASCTIALCQDRPFAIDIPGLDTAAAPGADEVCADTNFMALGALLETHRIRLDLNGLKRHLLSGDRVNVGLKRASDARPFGQYTFTCQAASVPPAPDTAALITPSGQAAESTITFRYLPERFFIDITRVRGEMTTVLDKTTVVQHSFYRTIITDRDRTEPVQGTLQPIQKTFLIEGDRFNPLGYVVAWSLVSTGKPNMDDHPGDYTPLGYYYIKSKEENAYNGREGRQWTMPHALWYTRKAGTPEGINGLHGFTDTEFGREASHGCTREPLEFARAAFAWCPVDTPVIIIGDQAKHHQDQNRFDLQDYPAFQTLLTELLDFRKQIEACQYEQTTLPTQQLTRLDRRRPLLEQMRQRPLMIEPPLALQAGLQIRPLFGQDVEP